MPLGHSVRRRLRAAKRKKRKLAGMAMTLDEACRLDLTEAARRLARKELSSVALTEAMLARIGRLDPALGSYATVTPELALAQARAADAALAAGRTLGPLHGVPIAVKD